MTATTGNTEGSSTSIPSTTTPSPRRKRRPGFRSPTEVPKLPSGDHSDRACRGLSIRVTAAGARTFRWRLRGEHRTITLGPWTLEPQAGALTLSQARDWHERLTAARRAGVLAAKLAELDTLLGSNRPAPALAPEAPPTLAHVLDEFYARRLCATRKHPAEAKAIIDREIVPTLGARPIREIGPRDVVRVVQAVVDRPAPATAQKTLALLKMAFRFAEGRAIVDRNPASALDLADLGIAPAMRQRALDPAEVPILWRALDTTRTDPRSLNHHKPEESRRLRLGIKLLLATGVRCGELILARWEDVDLAAATWTIPPENQKGTRRHAATMRPFVVPLSTLALGLLQELKVAAGDSPWVMASAWADAGHMTRRGPWGALQAALAACPLPGGPLTVHDLRRSCRSGLGRLGVRPDVAERVLNHSLPALWRTYDVSDFLPARREALQQWADHIARLLRGEVAEVVALHPAQPGGAS